MKFRVTALSLAIVVVLTVLLKVYKVEKGNTERLDHGLTVENQYE